MDTPLGDFSCPLAFYVREFNDEVNDNLPFYGNAGAILHIELVLFNCL